MKKCISIFFFFLNIVFVSKIISHIFKIQISLLCCLKENIRRIIVIWIFVTYLYVFVLKRYMKVYFLRILNWNIKFLINVKLASFLCYLVLFMVWSEIYSVFMWCGCLFSFFKYSEFWQKLFFLLAIITTKFYGLTSQKTALLQRKYWYYF